MRRDTLKAFFRQTVIITLPLLSLPACTPSGPAASACNGEKFIPGATIDGGCVALCTNTPFCDQLDAGVCCYQDHTGRRPAELEPAPQLAGSALGRWLAGVAYLEDASVQAFRTLAVELEEHGAPAALRAAAVRAMHDEVRHARMTAALARRHGVQPAVAPVCAAKPRSLEAIAVENATEGCVRETFGALVATWQARVAGNNDVRRAMRIIAAEETDHAELAWAVRRFCEQRLDRQARRRVRDAERVAAAELHAATAVDPDAELVAQAGLPTRTVARQLVATAERLLWS
jgi:hypothetical protein